MNRSSCMPSILPDSERVIRTRILGGVLRDQQPGFNIHSVPIRNPFTSLTAVRRFHVEAPAARETEIQGERDCLVFLDDLDGSAVWSTRSGMGSINNHRTET